MPWRHDMLLNTYLSNRIYYCIYTYDLCCSIFCSINVQFIYFSFFLYLMLFGLSLIYCNIVTRWTFFCYICKLLVKLLYSSRQLQKMSGQKMGSIKLIGCLWHSIGSHCKCLRWNIPSQDNMNMMNGNCCYFYLVFYSCLVLFADSKRVTIADFMLNCNFVYETVASCHHSSFLNIFNVCWISSPKVFVAAGFMEGSVESWWSAITGQRKRHCMQINYLDAICFFQYHGVAQFHCGQYSTLLSCYSELSNLYLAFKVSYEANM